MMIASIDMIYAPILNTYLKHRQPLYPGGQASPVALRELQQVLPSACGANLWANASDKNA